MRETKTVRDDVLVITVVGAQEVQDVRGMQSVGLKRIVLRETITPIEVSVLEESVAN